jgi:hypothetical protein
MHWRLGHRVPDPADGDIIGAPPDPTCNDFFQQALLATQSKLQAVLQMFFDWPTFVRERLQIVHCDLETILCKILRDFRVIHYR